MLALLLSICDPKYHDRITMLVNTYHDDLLIYAKYILKNAGMASYRHDAEDVVQNLYMKLARYCESVRFHESPQVMRGYLKKILKNEAYAHEKAFLFKYTGFSYKIEQRRKYNRRCVIDISFVIKYINPFA